MTSCFRYFVPLVLVAAARAQSCSDSPTLGFSANQRIFPASLVTWVPACVVDSLQIYNTVDPNPIANIPNAISGQYSIAGLVGKYTGPAEIKIWVRGMPASVFVFIVDCQQAGFTIPNQQPMLPIDKVTWAPPDCIAGITAYRDGNLIFRRDLVKSGDLTWGDLWRGDGPVSVSLFMGGDTPVDIKIVILRLPNGLTVTEDFEPEPTVTDVLLAPESLETTEELVPNGCFVVNAGSSRITRDTSAHLARAVVVESNSAKMPGIQNHVSLHRRSARSPLTGEYYLGVWAKIDGDTAGDIGTGPEFAVAETLMRGGVWHTVEAGFQYRAGCELAIWTNTVVDSTTTKPGPHWEVFGHSCLDAEVFHHLAITFDWNGNYKAFTIGDSMVGDIAGFSVGDFENKFREWAVVWSVEAEARATCGTLAVASFKVTYDYLEIRPSTKIAPSLKVVSRATFAEGKAVAAGSVVSVRGVGLAARTKAAETSPLPFALDDVTISVSDGDDKSSPAQLFRVSSDRIDFLMPSVRLGRTLIMARRGDSVVAVGETSLARVAPGLFGANDDPGGPLAGFVNLSRANGSADWVPTYQCVLACTTNPVPLTPDARSAILVLWGTGMASLLPQDACVEVGGSPVTPTCTPLSLGPAPSLVGVEQIMVDITHVTPGKNLTVVLRTKWTSSNAPVITIRQAVFAP